MRSTGTRIIGAVFGSLAVAHHADGDLRAAVERVHEVDVRRGEAVVLGDGDGEQFGLGARFERVNDGEGERVIDVVADIGVEDQGDGAGREQRRGCEE